ncbi:MAG: hypothetical protein ACLFQV_00325 [Vulcanimicrobiota bacterium]
MKKKLIIILFLFTIFTHQVFAREFLYSPAPDSHIKNNRPTIMFSFPRTGIDLKSVEMFVNGVNVTTYVIKSNNSIIYGPFKNLPAGRNMVRVTFRDSEDNNKEVAWAFFIEELDMIYSIEHNARSFLVVGEKLKVRVKGEPDSKATFSLGNIAREIPLHEISPGVYEGSYTVKKGDFLKNEKIIVSFCSQSGETCDMQAESTVSIQGRFFAVKITEPENWTQPGSNFFVKGRTNPDTAVYVNVQLSYNLGNTIVPLGQPGTYRTISDSHGHFEYKLNFPVSVGGLMAIIKVTAVKAGNTRSIPDQVTIFLGTPRKHPNNELDRIN